MTIAFLNRVRDVIRVYRDESGGNVDRYERADQLLTEWDAHLIAEAQRPLSCRALNLPPWRPSYAAEEALLRQML